ncbi:MoxR family ATPase [Streptomyces sp. MBT33]|uniref:AAA family ATPase n=1 Tax=Streptomyces sp. MBT33 TaxID=1488363 RepID=UPI00190E4C47|nr:MoxR family ATPase [Streptomyces sp. MBT33]MBK3645002.1 MoxR family ATPase [Streptomyces sp. MBT33]
MSEWLVYRGNGEPAPGRIDLLPEPPDWRRFDGEPLDEYPVPDIDSASVRRLGKRPPLPVQDARTIELINAALYLRRPLLVTGEPGSGKSTLAHALAHELALGRVLHWPVVSRTELKSGLYAYDAIARLQDAQISRSGVSAEPGVDAGRQDVSLGRYIRLGPLGTALLPSKRPRVLLIDELDKSDIDLPNDLLNVMEEGEYAIPELERISDRPAQATVEVLTDDGLRAPVTAGRVRCCAFPIIVMTSNGEREFPAPLLRRCIQLHLDPPRGKRLAAMVQAHFGEGADRTNRDLVDLFSTDSAGVPRPADQLLNAIFLTHHVAPPNSPQRTELARMLMGSLDPGQG